MSPSLSIVKSPVIQSLVLNGSKMERMSPLPEMILDPIGEMKLRSRSKMIFFVAEFCFPTTVCSSCVLSRVRRRKIAGTTGVELVTAMAV